jgi:uncharacterized protein involved in exopolysaccharide biosynthesis
MTNVETETGPSIGDLFAWIWAQRVSLMVGAVVGLAAAAAYYKTAQPVYSASIVVMPVADGDSGSRLGGLIGQLGGVGSLLGAGLSGESATQRHLAIFKSRAFAEQFIRANDLLPLLFYKRWNAAAKRWNVDGKDPPTVAEGVRLIEGIRTIAEDRRAGLVTVSIRWHDATLTATWANALMAFANQKLREQQIAESETTTRFVSSQIAETQALGVKEALYRVLEDQMKTMTLARTRPDYAFRIIDPAQTPMRRDRVSPRLIPVAFTGLVGGAALGLLLRFALPRLRRRKAA